MSIIKKIIKQSWVFTIFMLAKKARRVLKPKYSISKTLNLYLKFCKDFFYYKKHNANHNIQLRSENIYPQIFDNTEQTPLDYVYFYQDTWCAKKIFKNKPDHHYDFGSKAEMIGIISQFTPVTMLDIRPIDVELDGLSFQKADILKTGIPDGTINSLSSICVLEHIGLGRYGDSLDSMGTEKSVTEIKRILATDGDLYISLPVDKENRTYFNAHRAFTRQYILDIFSPLNLIEEKYIYGRRMQDSYEAEKGFGTGLFHFKK